MLALADRLKVPLAAVEAMTVCEFAEWMAYLKMMKELTDGSRRPN